MIDHDYEKMSWHVDHIKRHIEHTPSAVEACITQGLTEYAEHQAKRYEARIAELEQGIDSQAILAAAKELGRVEVAAVMYQAMGTIDASAMPEGEWMRCMDWLSSTANGEDVGELLPVGAIGEDV